MFILSVVNLLKELAEQFSKPSTYGSELEQYIVSHNPQDAGDVDRLMREFDSKHTGGFLC